MKEHSTQVIIGIVVMCMTLLLHDYLSIPAPIVKVVYQQPPAFNETTAFCIGCVATAGHEIYAGRVLPGGKPWRIEHMVLTVGVGDNPNSLTCVNNERPK